MRIEALVVKLWGGEKLRRGIFYFIYLIVILEFMFQVILLTIAYPGFSYHTMAPFGRNYETQFDKFNTILNWHGGNYISKRPSPNTPITIIIGDSFVQAAQVRPENHMCSLMQALYDSTEGTGIRQILGLGISGGYPAYYLEYLKLANDGFLIKDAIITIYLGNDFQNPISELQPSFPPNIYMYYEFNENGQLALVPGSEIAKQVIIARTRLDLYGGFLNIPRTILSNLVLPQYARKFRYNFRLKEILSKVKQHSDNNNRSIVSVEFEKIGLSSFIFDTTEVIITQKTISLTKAILDSTITYAERNSINLWFVTIPSFPISFYKTYSSGEWTPQLGKYDLFRPERLISEYCKSRQVALLQLGRLMQEKELLVEDVRKLYDFSGIGHLTKEGHRFFANEVFKWMQAETMDDLNSVNNCFYHDIEESN